jgi:glycosyltransferase 2 family protein
MNKKILTLLKFFLSITLLLLIFKGIDLTKTMKLLRNIDPVLYFLSLLILGIQILLASFRWKLVLKKLSFSCSSIILIKYLWIGLFFNQALPSSIGGDAIRGYYLNKNIDSIKNSSIGVILDRVCGLVGLLLLVLMLFMVFFNRLEDLNIHLLILFTLVALFAAIGLTFVLDLIPLSFSKLKSINYLFELSFKGRHLIFSRSPGVILLLLSIIIHLFSIAAVMTLSEALKLDIEWLGILLIVPVVTLFTLMPISIAGWGVRESVMIIGLGYINVPPEQALALSILYGLLMGMISLPGGVIWLMINRDNQTSN